MPVSKIDYPQWTPEQLALWTREELEDGYRFELRVEQRRQQILERQQASASPAPTGVTKPTKP